LVIKCSFKLCVYYPGVFSKLNKIGLISQTHLLFFYLMYYSGDIYFKVDQGSVFYVKGLMMTK